MHFASLTLFGPAATSGEKLFESFRDHTVAQFDRLASYRRWPRETPFAIDHPVWVEAESLDLDYHIRHMALPRPGSMAQLRRLVAELHMTLLDRRRPLWQYSLIEGTGGRRIRRLRQGASRRYGWRGRHGDFAVHLRPVGRSAARREAAREEAPKRPPPNFPGMVGGAFADFVGKGLRLVGSLPAAARTVMKIARRPAQDMRYLIDASSGTPRRPSSTNRSPRGEASARRRSRYPRPSKSPRREDATINDVVLTICAGALRRYLTERKALPRACLTAAVPASLRARDDARLNNQVLFTLCKLATDQAEPLRRLAAVKASARDAKGLFADVKEVLTTDISIIGAPIVMTAAARLVGMTGAADLSSPRGERGHFQRAGPAQADLLCRGGGRALLPGVDPLPRPCAQHHRAKLPRQSRIRIDRLPRGGSRRATDRRLSAGGI